MDNWGLYFQALTGFAGVVFAITLAARQISEHQRQRESVKENTARLWDSVSVTYELAAGALFGALYLVRESWVAAVFGTLVAVTGLALYAVFGVCFHDLWLQERDRVALFDVVFAWLTLIPVTALVAGSVFLWMRVPCRLVEWFALAVTWLVFSGTTQALIWYVRSWERATSSS